MRLEIKKMGKNEQKSALVPAGIPAIAIYRRWGWLASSPTLPRGVVDQNFLLPMPFARFNCPGNVQWADCTIFRRTPGVAARVGTRARSRCIRHGSYPKGLEPEVPCCPVRSTTPLYLELCTDTM